VIISPPTTVERRLSWLLAAAAALAGAAAWAVFFRAGLVLSHYDAKAHLVVARRVIDNLTPGWQQIGAVWLPLPHLIEILPTQVDLFYRTGAFASLVSIGCLAVTTYAAARLILRVTGSRPGAAVCAALLALNPNLLYLHTTPMTEPLLLASSMLVVLWLLEWVDDDRDTVPPRLALALFAAAWTRYEAWAVIGAALAAAGYATWRRGSGTATLRRRLSRLGVWPALAVAVFVVNSRITVGSWFVSDGFFVPDPTYAHQPLRTLLGIWWGTHQLSGYAIEAVALGAAAVIAWRSLSRRTNSLKATHSSSLVRTLSGCHTPWPVIEVPVVIRDAIAAGPYSADAGWSNACDHGFLSSSSMRASASRKNADWGSAAIAILSWSSPTCSSPRFRASSALR